MLGREFVNKVVESKKIYIDILRIFACFMVIINHTHGFILDYKSDINIIFYCILFSLCKIGVPIFLMITSCIVICPPSLECVRLFPSQS